MTMMALPKQPEASRPSPGYNAAALREESEAKALTVLNDGADAYWEGFWHDCDALMLLEWPTPPPAKRLVWYENKPTFEQPPVPPLAMTDKKGAVEMVPQPQPPATGSWMGQKLDFPEDFYADIKDWVQLSPTSFRRDQVLREIAGAEMQQAAQQAMAAPPALPPLAPPTSGVVEKLPDVKWGG